MMNIVGLQQITTRKFVFALFTLSTLLVADPGEIKGIVLDEVTQQPLVGVNVILEGTSLGAATGEMGNFVIPHLELGFYHVRFEMIGYQPLVKMNVRIHPKRGAYIRAELKQQVLELEGVTVTRAFYQKEKDALVSSRTVDLEEIRRDPSGVIDIQRMMQALPSVVSTADQQNEIVVRGGAPGENLFIMDNIEIANPNHFGMQGTGGGPINMVNTLFIDRVDFLAGAFPAKYGDKASSVMNIRLREGNRDRHTADLDLSIAGIGFLGEGPMGKDQGSYMVSFRKSYLDLIIRQTGLVAVPKYWNTQAKLTYDINPTNKILLNFIYGDDGINIVGENTPQTRGAENVKARDNQSAVGVTYQRLWQKNGLSRFTLAYTDAQFVYDVFQQRGSGQKHTNYKQDETEWDVQFRGDFVWRANKRFELSGGIDVKQIGIDFNAWADQDTVWIFSYSLPSNPDSFMVIDQRTWETNVYPVIANAEADSIYLDRNDIWHYGRQTDGGGWEHVLAHRSDYLLPYSSWTLIKDEFYLRYGGFVQLKWRPWSRVTLNLGLRIGHLDLTNFSWLAPRLGFSYFLSDRSTVNMAFGRHYQSPALIVLTYHPENESLRSKYTNQIVVGIEHFFAEDTRGTIEFYWKDYQDFPIPLSSTTLDTADESRIYINTGEGYSYGVEFFLQKKLARDFFGTLSYSHYRAISRDPRYPNQKKYFPWDFDFKNVLTAVGGYKIPLKGPDIKPLGDRHWFTRLLGKTLGLGAQELELSFRYCYVGGKPYTPLVYNHLVRRWYENESVEYNSKRLSPYHRFDLMILWHVRIGKNMNLISYFDLQNVFNRDNVWDFQRNPDGTMDKVYQFKVFPVGGFTLEF